MGHCAEDFTNPQKCVWLLLIFCLGGTLKFASRFVLWEFLLTEIIWLPLKIIRWISLVGTQICLLLSVPALLKISSL